tara:strand:+ start:158 stop:691 length:534 start_codon:yes stop_codon:yes gene_type:complete
MEFQRPTGYIDVARIKSSSEAELSIYIDEYMNIIHNTTPPKYEEMAFHILDLFWEGYPNQEKEAYGSFIYSLVKNRGQQTVAFYIWFQSWIPEAVTDGTLMEDIVGVRDTLRDELVSQGHQVAGTRKNRRRRVSRKRRKNRKTKKGGRRVSRKRRKSSKKSNRKSKRRTNKSHRRRQ